MENKTNMTSDVSELTLQAHYGNRASATVTLSYQSISELPEEYYPDQSPGMDGTAPRSLKNPRSLLIVGINAKEIDALGWEPSELSFTDRRTGKQESFHVSRIFTQRPESAKFAVLG